MKEKDVKKESKEEKVENEKTEKNDKKETKRVSASRKSNHKIKENKKIAELTEQLEKEREKCLRIQAEMMNFKRRKEDEVAGIKKYANEDILKDLLMIVDNFERALKLETEENKEFLKGFSMIYTSILNILNENDVTEIPADNVAFDPEVHQAVLTDKVDGVEPGIIIEVLQKGYKYKDRVLRPAMVKVSE